MWTDRHYFATAVIIYGVATLHAIFLWRKGFRRDDWVNYLLLLAGFLLHTKAIFLRGLSTNHCPVHNLYEATSFSMWTSVGIYMVAGLFPRLRFLGAFASPALLMLGVFAMMPGLDTAHGTPAELPRVYTSLHAAMLALSYGAFGLSAVAATMYLTQEHNLKFHKLKAIFSLLPPIQRLETVTGRLLLSGFALLTVGLTIGAVGLGQMNEPGLYRGDPKIIWSAVVWLLYFGLIVMHWRFAQKGRRFALGTIGSFVFVLLTFWGSNLLSPLHNL